MVDDQESGPQPISVVLYVHNGEPYLAEALSSILGQSHENFELCVVDDGSTDGTADILAAIAVLDPRVRVQQQPAKGRERLHETFNACLAMARHELVAIANADDVWRPEKLERQLAAFEADPTLDVCYHEATFIDADGQLHWGGFRRYDSPYDTAAPRPWQFVQGNPIPNPTVMFRKAIVRRIGLQEVGDMHDHQFWFKATIAGCRFRGLPDRLIRYRVHEASHSTASSRVEVITKAHRACAVDMVRRHTIDELMPELGLVHPNDTESRAWAYSAIAGALWSTEAFDAAGDLWREARRLTDDPAVLCGIGLVGLRHGATREVNSLVRQAADLGVGHARAALAGGADIDSMRPPQWHGKKPEIAALVEQTDHHGLSLGRELCPDPFDVVLVVPDAAESPAELSSHIADQLVRLAHESTARTVGLASGPDDITILTAAYDSACAADPTLPDRLHLEVDVIPAAQRPSVIEAHQLDGAAIRS